MSRTALRRIDRTHGCRAEARPGERDADESNVSAVTPAPVRARPNGLEANRAGLMRSLAREPAVCRSVGLVR
jgi:hypothetical protein